MLFKRIRLQVVRWVVPPSVDVVCVSVVGAPSKLTCASVKRLPGIPPGDEDGL